MLLHRCPPHMVEQVSTPKQVSDCDSSFEAEAPSRPSPDPEVGSSQAPEDGLPGASRPEVLPTSPPLAYQPQGLPLLGLKALVPASEDLSFQGLLLRRYQELLNTIRSLELRIFSGVPYPGIQDERLILDNFHKEAARVQYDLSLHAYYTHLASFPAPRPPPDEFRPTSPV